MFKSYLTIAWRNLLRNKGVAILNVGGLAVAMAVVMLIGLWIWDEWSYDQSNENYDSIAQIARREVANGEVFIDNESNHFPVPLAAELRTNYRQLFKQVALATDPVEHLLAVDENKYAKQGMYVEPAFHNIFTLPMLQGTSAGFEDPGKILLSQSLAVALFGNSDPVGKIVILNSKLNITVSGVYADFPTNNRFAGIQFLCPMSLLVATNEQVKQNQANWGNSSFLVFVQTALTGDMAGISKSIKDVYWPKIETTQPKKAAERTTLFLHPMKDWHLRSEWKNGEHSGGQIQLLWLFGIIGGLVLLVACINFMNLSTARYEKRAKEVGIRKTFGSRRKQLMGQFLSESLLIVCIAFLLSIGLVWLGLDSFNTLADKKIVLSFANPVFWLIAAFFIMLTALIAGSYPAFYLSSFRPVSVLKGTFRAGKLAVTSRRVMTGLQFTVSIILIIGTIVVYRQIQHGQNRPVGYNREGLIRITMNTPDLNGKYDVLQKELLSSGGAAGFAQSSSTITANNYFDDHFEWEGKNDKVPQQSFALLAVTSDFGKTVGWEFLQGRDFSNSFPTDNAAIILNEAAVKYMRISDPVGKAIKWNGNPYTVVGVIKDMITESPFKPVQQSIFFMVPNVGPVITVRLNPALTAAEAIQKIEPVFRKLNPSAPFEYTFVDEEYGAKFAAEERTGMLSGFFATLAIFISCLGMLGMAAFIAQQRMKEVSIRKVLGASVPHIWRLLIQEFAWLVVIAFMMAVPIANYFAGEWLQQYAIRSEIKWWIFALAGLAAMLITLLTVSFHALKAAMGNPVKSLRPE